MGISSEGKVCPSFSLHCFPSLQAVSSEQPVMIAQGFQKPGQVVSSKPGFICALRHISWKHMMTALVITTNIRQHFFWKSPLQCSFSRDTRLRPLPWYFAPHEVEGFIPLHLGELFLPPLWGWLSVLLFLISLSSESQAETLISSLKSLCKMEQLIGKILLREISSTMVVSSVFTRGLLWVLF